MSTDKSVTRDNMIRAAGMVQAVIGSGAPMPEWTREINHGLNLSNYFANKLAGIKKDKVAMPPPLTLKEKNSGE